MPMTEYDDLRRRLLAQRAALLRHVARDEDDIRWLEANVETELVEESQEEVIARLLSQLDEHRRAEVEAVDHALVRIASGDYGRCERCGRLIPKLRLEALPTATTCVNCAA